MKPFRAKWQQWRLQWKDGGWDCFFLGIYFASTVSALLGLVGLGYFVYGTITKSSGTVHLGKMLMLPVAVCLIILAIMLLVALILRGIMDYGNWKYRKEKMVNEHHD